MSEEPIEILSAEELIERAQFQPLPFDLMSGYVRRVSVEEEFANRLLTQAIIASTLQTELQQLKKENEAKQVCLHYDVPDYMKDECHCPKCEPDYLRHELSTLKKENEALRKAIEGFKDFAKHKPGREIEFFRYLAESARRNNAACADTAVWDAVADALEALTLYKAVKEGEKHETGI